jgi:hypothetical protein
MMRLIDDIIGLFAVVFGLVALAYFFEHADIFIPAAAMGGLF